MPQLSFSNYIYTVFRRLRLISLICFLSLTSNLVGNFVWTYMDNKESIALSSEEDDSEERDSDPDENNNGSSKRAINLLEEELHLAEHTSLFGFDFDLKRIQKSNFSVITDKTNGSKKAPLDNPPEIDFELS
ncbi:MAG: hypothetical protein K0S23_1747 [Fluviicola sp.]|nr:hypothetical protein [Fluviicola sp.]